MRPGPAARLPAALVPALPAALVPALVAGGSGALVGAALRRAAPRALDRSAHVGRPVSLAAGPATAVGLLVAVLVTGPRGALPAVAAAAAAGALDDLAGTGSPVATDPAGTTADPAGTTTDTAGTTADPAGTTTDPATRGLSGHLGALAGGRVTTGSVKVLVIGCGALVSAALLDRRTDTDPVRPRRVLADGALVAGTANLLNLLDLRPGRAGKVTALAASALSLRRSPGGAGGRTLASAVLGAVAAELPRDLAGTWMLGDCGANALGAGLGAAVVAGRGPRVRTVLLLVVLGLTLLSERVSFSDVIDRRPVLAWLDGLGRPVRPVGPVHRPAGDPAPAPGRPA